MRQVLDRRVENSTACLPQSTRTVCRLLILRLSISLVFNSADGCFHNLCCDTRVLTLMRQTGICFFCRIFPDVLDHHVQSWNCPKIPPPGADFVHHEFMVVQCQISHASSLSPAFIHFHPLSAFLTPLPAPQNEYYFHILYMVFLHMVHNFLCTPVERVPSM